MPRKSKTNGFVIDAQPTAEDSDDSDDTPTSPVVKDAKKKAYNFSEARRLALERGRKKRAENLELRKVECDAQKQKVKAAKEEALANKIKEQLEDEIGADPEVVKQKVRASKKSRASAKKIPPTLPKDVPLPESESESGDENDGLAPALQQQVFKFDDGSSSEDEEPPVVVKRKQRLVKKKKKRRVVIIESDSGSDSDGYQPTKYSSISGGYF